MGYGQRIRNKSVTWDEFLVVADAFGKCMEGDFEPTDAQDAKVFELLTELGLWDECDGYIGDDGYEE